MQYLGEPVVGLLDLGLRRGGRYVQDLEGIEAGHLVVELRDAVREEEQKSPAQYDGQLDGPWCQSPIRLGTGQNGLLFEAVGALAFLV